MTTTCLAVLVDQSNESRTREGIQELLDRSDTRLVIVTLSDDDVGAMGWAAGLAHQIGSRCTVLRVAPSTEKGEAVRRGLNTALEQSPDIVGYVSDGFATPASEVLRLADLMNARACSVLLGARVAMLGSQIRRSVVRHYLGRCFAALASTVLRTDIYDTQCGVKLFRPSPALGAALARPFISKVAFDVELLGRLLAGEPGVSPLTQRDIVEIPLQRWDGSANPVVQPREVSAALRDLVQIRNDLGRHRA